MNWSQFWVIFEHLGSTKDILKSWGREKRRKHRIWSPGRHPRPATRLVRRASRRGMEQLASREIHASLTRLVRRATGRGTQKTTEQRDARLSTRPARRVTRGVLRGAVPSRELHASPTRPVRRVSPEIYIYLIAFWRKEPIFTLIFPFPLSSHVP